MELADAHLLRTAAQTTQEALRISLQCDAADAPKAMRADAYENAVNAGTLLTMAIRRWLKTL